MVGVGLCASESAVISCLLVLSGNAFDFPGFCGNIGVTQDPSVASISAFIIKNREWSLCLWVYGKLLGIGSQWRGQGVRRSFITSKAASLKG